MKKPAIVSVVALSGTGKTTLLEKLIAGFKMRGYRVGALKHDAHRFDIDHKNKDSWRMTQAGADTMVITSREKLAMVKMNRADEEPSAVDIVDRYFNDVDLVLTEGFKGNSFPKIEVHRKAKNDKLLCRGDVHDKNLLAVASDEPLDLDVPVFGIDDAQGICDFIEQRFLKHV